MRTGLVWPGLKLSSNFIAHNTVLIDRMCILCGGSNFGDLSCKPSYLHHPTYVSREAA